MDLLDLMPFMHHSPNAYCYNTAASACARAGHWELLAAIGHEKGLCFHEFKNNRIHASKNKPTRMCFLLFNWVTL